MTDADVVVVDERIVSQLLEEQFRALASPPLTAVEKWGTDHALWRLGDDLVSYTQRPRML